MPKTGNKGSVKWWLLIVCCAAGALLLGITILPSLALRNTSFSRQWSESGFSSVQQRDSVQTVLTNLGLPLCITVNFGSAGGLPVQIKSPSEADIERYTNSPSGNLVLQYSECANRFGDSFRNVSVTIMNGRVYEKRDEVYHEFW